MQVFLIKENKIADVADGHGKFLVKSGQAKSVDAILLAQLKAKQQSQEFHHGQDVAKTKEIAEKLKSVIITLQVKLGANNKMFGSVTGTEIAEKLAEQGFQIDKKSLLFDAIKDVGEYIIKVKMSHGILGQFKLKVEGK